jgi:dolichol-phosphate mannosyltransferase
MQTKILLRNLASGRPKSFASIRNPLPVELQIVLPVYNEGSVLPKVLDEWCPQFDRCCSRYVVVAIDDGSTDETSAILQALSIKWGPKLEIIRQQNRGHGQTVLKGYQLAFERGIPWVFQIDSDGQCDPRYFPRFWQARRDYDVVSAYRFWRRDGWYRALVSTVLRWFIFLLSGIYCRDANVPYRLMRTEAIKPLLGKIPDTFSIANVALAILAKRAKLRHSYVPIVFRARSGGEPSVRWPKFANKALDLYRNLKDLLAN